MQALIDYIRLTFVKAITTHFSSATPLTDLIEITKSTQPKFGHYQCNAAMKMSRVLKMPPRDIAQKILEAFHKEPAEFVKEMTIAGPGFINITLNSQFISQRLEMMENDELHFGIPLPKSPQKVVIDFSSPNVAKEMHVGHLRSTIIGDCLARLFEFLGHTVLRLNHIGDWGTAFGMLIRYLKEHEPHVITGEQSTDLSHLVDWYKRSKKLFDEDPEFKKRAQAQVVALQAHEPQAYKAWEIICAISQKAYQEIYTLLSIELTDRGESFYNPFLKDILKDAHQKGILEESDGAKCVFLEGFKNREGQPLPFILQKSDGGFNYSTTDMAAIKHRIHVENAQRLIYVTDAGQSVHFKMLFAAAEKAGYLDPNKVRTDHVPFGLVLGQDGKKFKTRSGKTERLIDLLQEAINRSKEILKQRQADNPQEHIDENLEHIAKVLGIGAVKYADLSGNRINDYQFDYDKMLKFEGNTAAFLMYAYVRVSGIKRKLEAKGLACSIEKAQFTLEHTSEINLGVHLCQFHENLNHLADDLLPNRLCEYLYELAEKFNAFFRDCRVIDSEHQHSRLALCELVSRVLKKGLDILGLKVVEQM